MKAGKPPLRLRLIKVRVGKTWMWLLTSVLDKNKLNVKHRDVGDRHIRPGTFDLPMLQQPVHVRSSRLFNKGFPTIFGVMVDENRYTLTQKMRTM